MEEKQQKNINSKGKLFYFNLKNGVKIYLKENELLKFSKQLKFYKNFNNIITKVVDDDSFAKINYLIYNGNSLCGYSMKFYQDSKTLKQLFKKDLILKKEDCLKIENAFNLMTNKNIYYSDIYRNNFIITEDGDFKIIDLESLKENTVFDLCRFNKKMSAVLALSYIYGIETNQICALIKNQSKFLKENNDKLFNYFYNLNKNSSIDKLLELISLEDIKFNRKKLLIEAKELSSNQYFKKYYY